MPLPEITEDKISDLASGASPTKGYSYFHNGSVVELSARQQVRRK